MFDHLFEWLASKSNPRVRAYREARLLYESYVRELYVQFEALTSQHFRQAVIEERLQVSERLYRQAIELSHEANALDDIATALYQLGMLLHLQGRFEEASQSLRDSLRILEDLPRSEQATISGCHYHLGLIALRQGCVEEAKRYLNQSLKIDTATSDIHGVTLCKSALAKCDEAKDADNVTDDGEDVIPYKSDETDTVRTPIYEGETYVKEPAVPPVEEEMAPELTYDNISKDVIWLLSHSVAVNDWFMAPLEQLAGQLSRKLIVSRTAFGSAIKGKSTPPPLAQNERLCAAILVIEKDGLDHEEFRYWTNWCIGNVAARDDFRLFVGLNDLTTDEIKERANQGDRLCDTLLDTVQISETPTPAHLRDALRDYLQQLDDIRTAALWRRVRVNAAIILGRIAGIVQLCCGVALGVVTLAAIVLGSESVVVRLANANDALVALVTVIMGIVLFPLLATPLFLLFKGLAIANSLLQNSPHIGRWLILFALFGPATIGLSQRIGTPTSWIVLGVVTGVLLDITRRNGYQARRAQISLKKALEICYWPLPTDIAEAAIEGVWDPLRCPLFPAIAPKVFISYTTHTNWSSTHASGLHNMLRNIGTHSSLDQDIGEGSHWRSHLNRSLIDANVFIAILDEISICREWVAAEMITALVSRRLTSLPEIIILMDPQLSQFSGDSIPPVFTTLLQNHGDPPQEGQPHFITVKDTTLQTLISGLQPHRYSTSSIFPPKLTVLLSFLTTPAVTIGAIGPIFGIAAALFAYFQYWDKVQSSTLLSSWGILTATYLICGYWLGFVGRLSVASRFEVRHTNVKALTWIHTLSSIGFLGILAVWYMDVPKLIVGWAVALCWIGWLVSNLFIGRVGQENLDFRRASD